MRICRFDANRLGVVEDDFVRDVTGALDVLPPQRWPYPPGDALIANLSAVRAEIERLAPHAERLPVSRVALRSPVANPGKIMAAPANYAAHLAVDGQDPGIDQESVRQLRTADRPTEKFGLFLKATSSIAGPADGVAIVFPDRRTDFEVELAVVIGRTVKSITQAEAMDCVAGFCIGMDMSVRGQEDRSYRKSADTYTVLGPWIVTTDAIADPHDLNLSLSVNGVTRQSGSTSEMTVRIERIIELASHMYTLHPGDVLMTGTPQGVGPVAPGDVMRAGCSSIGWMEIPVH